MLQTVAKESKLLKEKVINLKPDDFQNLALEIFRFQIMHCKPYGRYIRNLGIDPTEITDTANIPYLPISAFKNHKVTSGEWKEELVFTSSTTTGSIPSSHYVKDLRWYEKVSSACFDQFYGSIDDYSFFGLLPSYMERGGSSLINMLQYFIRTSHKRGGFYLYDHKKLFNDLNETPGKKILFGVSYALLDFIDVNKGAIPDLTVMETGGMKGRKEELSRSELHDFLKNGFQIEDIHSEYGMTEMMSQAYSQGNGIFYCPASMKISTVQVNDPLEIEKEGRTGIIRIMDLANIDSCSFIMTDDLGIIFQDGSFEVLGRADHSEIRGCNLMVSDL